MVDPGLIVEALGETCRNQAVQVLKSLIVLGQQHEVVVVSIFDLFEKTAAGGDIYFTSDDRMDAFFRHGLKEFHTSVHDAVIRDGTGSHAQFLKTGSQLLDADRTIQKTVFGM